MRRRIWPVNLGQIVYLTSQILYLTSQILYLVRFSLTGQILYLKRFYISFLRYRIWLRFSGQILYLKKRGIEYGQWILARMYTLRARLYTSLDIFLENLNQIIYLKNEA